MSTELVLVGGFAVLSVTNAICFWCIVDLRKAIGLILDLIEVIDSEAGFRK